MGSTITTGKLAAAFPAPNGVVIYVLFEQTYESNVYPKTPHWSCTYVGPISGAVRRVFQHAAAAEGGSLRNRTRTLTPESYIAGWMKELANPVEYYNYGVTLEQGTSLYSAINDETWDAAWQVLQAHNRQDLWDALQVQGKVSLQLFDDIYLLADLCERAKVSPWCIVSSTAPQNQPRRPDLGYRPIKSKPAEREVPQFLKVDDNELLMQQEDGDWKSVGGGYSVVDDFVSKLWQDELREPGGYATWIKQYRKAALDAPPLPPGTVVRVDETIEPMHAYQRRAVLQASRDFPMTVTPNGYEITVTQDKSLLYALTHLPAECTTWIVPQFQAEQAQAVQMQAF
jgi:hypothetical protein